MIKNLRFVWFWTFWHWSKEGQRTGALAGDPLLALGENWAHWFQHDASEEDRLAIAEAGESDASQAQFVTWLFRHWPAEAGLTSNRLVPRFVLSQLAAHAPFSAWSTLERYRTLWGSPGLPAIVLAEHSRGESTDVRAIEALLLPAADAAERGSTVAEGFKVAAADLQSAHRAAGATLAGRGRNRLFFEWLIAGRRPYGRALRIILRSGWFALAGLTAWMLFGPEPGDLLPVYGATLLFLWCGLLVTAATTATVQAIHLWREGREWAARLAAGQARLRMAGGLTLEGGSAGLAFVLNILLATHRSHPGGPPRSWILRRIFEVLDREAPAWAATGVISSDGAVAPVVLAPKLRACVQDPAVRHVLTPRQRESRAGTFARLREAWRDGLASAPTLDPAGGSLRGFAAAETHPLHLHRGNHVAHALARIGALLSPAQLAFNFCAFGLSLVMLAALPDLRSILLPAQPPAAVAPASPSPYFLWVSLDTPYAGDFTVQLESRFWINRRVNVIAHSGPNASTRAEIRLIRLSNSRTAWAEDGLIWVERRRKFLTREYVPGERVGQYTLNYLNHLGRE